MLRQAAAWAVLALAGQVQAFTLGPAQGQILIGHPLDLRLRAEGAGFDADGVSCLEAELLYGDSRVPAAIVTLTLLPADAAGASALRVRATQPVNEPLVTLMVSMGCSDRYTRRYQLLADQDPVLQALERGADSMPRPSLPNAREAEISVADPAPTAEPMRSPDAPLALPPRAARAQPAAVERAKPRSVRTRIPAPAATTSAAPARPPRARAAPSATPRLELELIETPAPAESGAGSATAAGGSGSGMTAGPVRPEAVSAAAPVPAEATPQDARLQEMARELESMRAEQARMIAVVESVNAQLAQARVSRWQDPLLLGLLGSSAASLLGLLLAWARLRRQHWA